MRRQKADKDMFSFVFAVLSVWRWVGSRGLLIQLNEPVKVIKALGRLERR